MKLHRDKQDANGTLGVWSNDHGVRMFDTIEPEHPMPAGTYRVRLRYSPSHGYAVPGWLDVPGHQDIEMHPGNTTADTRDCVCPGDRRGAVMGSDGVVRPGVLNSRVTFAAFMRSTGVPDYTSLANWDAVRAFRQNTPGAGDFTVEITDPEETS